MNFVRNKTRRREQNSKEWDNAGTAPLSLSSWKCSWETCWLDCQYVLWNFIAPSVASHNMTRTAYKYLKTFSLTAWETKLTHSSKVTCLIMSNEAKFLSRKNTVYEERPSILTANKKQKLDFIQRNILLSCENLGSPILLTFAAKIVYLGRWQLWSSTA